MKKWIRLSFAFAAVLLLAACGNDNDTAGSSSTSSSTTNASTETSTSESVDVNTLELPQLETETKPNEDVVDLVTSMGTIRMKLFPELAPKAVENFMTHAKENYYDGVIFHRVIQDFMIQTGDPEGTGAGGESIWGKGFGEEISNQLYHIRGAVAMAKTSQPNSQGSQFYIVQNNEDMSGGVKESAPDRIVEAYKNGGAPHLDSAYTVFGQVIEGMDVVDAIAALDEGSSNGTPTDVTIDSIDIIQEAE